jgi:GT2 family glycosyltransferase
LKRDIETNVKPVQPMVCIVIVNWNGLTDTVECLESLRKISYSNYKVVIVDNYSKGNDVTALKEKFADYIDIIRNDQNYGFAGGNNIGMRYAIANFQPDYLLVLNNDTVVDPVFLTAMVDVAERDQLTGVIGTKTYFYDEPNRLQAVWGKMNFMIGEARGHPQVIASKWRIKEIDKGQYNSIRAVDHVGGSCFMIKRSIIDNIGMLDESFSSYWEETDFFFRTRKAGYKIYYVPAAKIWHKGGRSAVKVPGIVRYYMTRNRFWFMKKHASAWQYAFFLTYFFGFYYWLATVYYFILLHSYDMLANFNRGIKDGLRGNSGGSAI